MKCPVHSDRDVIGYCVDCGAFGCDQCLADMGKGESLCSNCRKQKSAAGPGGQGLVSKLFGEKKTPKPRSAKPSFAKSSVARKSRAGRKLEVHFRDGKTVKGSTYKLDLNSISFHLVPVEPIEGQDRITVNFADVNSIHVVRDFDGAGSSEATGDIAAEGQEVKVAFRDGTMLEGHALHRFDPNCKRFFIVPRDGVGGSISILVERAALKGLEMEGYKEGTFAASAEEEMAAEAEAKAPKRAPLSQNESMGDLYFSMKNYDNALSEYDKVHEEFPNDKRLGMKIAVCNFNRGVNFVKSRKYVEAKAEFQKIGEDDPIYGKAKKKIRKIDKLLKDAERIGG